MALKQQFPDNMMSGTLNAVENFPLARRTLYAAKTNEPVHYLVKNDSQSIIFFWQQNDY